MPTTATDWTATIREIGPTFAARAVEHDNADRFVSANYADLKQRRLFSAQIPTDLGGGGCTHSQMCGLIRELAGYCGSTALAFSMHQHLVAAAAWNNRHGRPGEQLLRKVAGDEAVLISTGAMDWLASSGRLESCEGGFRFTAKKFFASGSPSGDLLVTSGQYEDPKEGWQVLHFPVPFTAEGVRIEEVWEAMGMRGTGSHNVVLQDVFVPAESVALRRPRGQYHPVWNVVLTVALPLICAGCVATFQKRQESDWSSRPGSVSCRHLEQVVDELNLSPNI